MHNKNCERLFMLFFASWLVSFNSQNSQFILNFTLQEEGPQLLKFADHNLKPGFLPPQRIQIVATGQEKGRKRVDVNLCSDGKAYTDGNVLLHFNIRFDENVVGPFGISLAKNLLKILIFSFRPENLFSHECRINLECLTAIWHIFPF